MRAFSKLVFGNADRLEVAAAIADSPSGVVHGEQIATALSIAPNRVRAQLLALTQAGLLGALPRVGLTVDYERRESPFWDLVSALANEF